MKASRWLDHLPAWLAWSAIACTGAYYPGELAAMALPLLAAALAEWRGWQLESWRRSLELLALAATLVLLTLRVGVLLLVIDLLFLLSGVRLCLPRGMSQRRQLLLMGFLLFLTTAVTTSEMDFLAWSVAWVAGAAALLMQLNWEQSATLRQGPFQLPPYTLVLRWTAAVLAVAACFFVTLPRLRVGMRRLPIGVQGLNGLRAGLSDVLDLNGSGPIQGSQEVAVRIQPAVLLKAQEFAAYREALGLLRGFVLEELEGQRWDVAVTTPSPDRVNWSTGGGVMRPVTADFFFGAGLLGTLPIPYGQAELAPPSGDPLRFGPGGSLRWAFPVRRTTALRVALTPAGVEPAPRPEGRRLVLLTATGKGNDSARSWSQRRVPVSLPPRELADVLTGALRASCTYTLDNPSGSAANPLQDFLENSHAGHCEYFASALALMLRYRGVPARVANGFRLGPWIDEGSYFLVTQGEAHSWVEYYDDEAGGWRVADPTPLAPPSPLSTGTFMASLARWTDAVRFRWDRNVVRFSDDDQLAGMDWAMGRLGALLRQRPGPVAKGLAGLAILGLLAWFFRRRLGRIPLPFAGPRRAWPGRIRELDPLVRRARTFVPPREAETARAWLDRLAAARPQRAATLATLAREADAAAYGDNPSGRLKRLAKDEARAWRG